MIFDNFDSDPFVLLTTADLRDRLEQLRDKLQKDAEPVLALQLEEEKLAVLGRAQLKDFYGCALEILRGIPFLRLLQFLRIMREPRAIKIANGEIYYVQMAAFQLRFLKEELANYPSLATERRYDGNIGVCVGGEALLSYDDSVLDDLEEIEETLEELTDLIEERGQTDSSKVPILVEDLEELGILKDEDEVFSTFF